jgi:hypothetical protein
VRGRLSRFVQIHMGIQRPSADVLGTTVRTGPAR